MSVNIFLYEPTLHQCEQRSESGSTYRNIFPPFRSIAHMRTMVLEYLLTQISSPWCWNICQHKNPIFMAQLGKSSSSMEQLENQIQHRSRALRMTSFAWSRTSDMCCGIASCAVSSMVGARPWTTARLEGWNPGHGWHSMVCRMQCRMPSRNYASHFNG